MAHTCCSPLERPGNESLDTTGPSVIVVASHSPPPQAEQSCSSVSRHSHAEWHVQELPLHAPVVL